MWAGMFLMLRADFTYWRLKPGDTQQDDSSEQGKSYWAMGTFSESNGATGTPFLQWLLKRGGLPDKPRT